MPKRDVPQLASWKQQTLFTVFWIWEGATSVLIMLAAFRDVIYLLPGRFFWLSLGWLSALVAATSFLLLFWLCLSDWRAAR